MEEEYHATVAVGNPSDRFDRPLEIRRSSDSSDGIDIISDLPDAVLQHIFSYIPTKFAIRTSVLSKRWRHVWSETPHLSFGWFSGSPKLINKTLASYSASKITSFHLCTRYCYKANHVNSSIEFAMSHNVENLSLTISNLTRSYCFPDLFFTNSSVKQLLVNLQHLYTKKKKKMPFVNLSPGCTVSWTSLKNLSLSSCKLSDDSLLKILSGCPILETLSLKFCISLMYVDLSKSLRLTRLEIERRNPFPEPMQIVAPHVRYLRLRDSEAQCTLLDVSSLTEANVDFTDFHPRTLYHGFEPLDPSVLLVTVQTMLEQFQNVEKLTLGVNFLQMLSLSKIPSLPLPTLKVKNLTLETRIMPTVVPGITRLLQNSPGLEKLTVLYTIDECSILLWECVNSYLKKQLKDVAFLFPWEYEVIKPKVMASFMELLLANTKTLETLVLHLGSCINRSRFEELSQIALTLSHNNKVSILLKRSGG
ncbi:unnamed protein product [Arabidopsis lyrata]|uniref:F-box domain-containing protein n=1 Tax=Arabidopsis lyrata subsp. lyrata TaxID=81972 RepID=D7M7X6_ARALL|nr:F-box/LRR-repeat protein 25 [Arabidopsis lyrata subsp. lyrata]EFH47260.1 hypothetical protein ARALYDRAFT_349579 [Arabidopsis lyrata subsp. lyrata]CAH8269843.1 unnamed protein product [Arabidopsis lyrata]|eukprot:XP_002871001.1 F-box/LRR-repeat protein 25 [Arabidopsis lyrata subsp. lyrata]